MSDREQFMLRQASNFDDMVHRELGMSTNEALKAFSEGRLKDGEPCSHRGCLNHVTHPCECCGRIAGRNMTDNEILARWQGKCWHFFGSSGGSCIYCGQPFGYPFNCSNPDYLNDDAAAMSLLDTLVEKGFYYSLIFVSDKHSLEINKRDFDVVVHRTFADTHREAIIAACLEVARKEQGNGRNEERS